MADPRFYLVTIASAVMSSDLRHAKVYWLIHGDEERRAEAQEAFDGAAGHFKRLISRELGIKFAPTVSFFYDDTLDQADEMERLFQRIREGSQSSE